MVQILGEDSSSDATVKKWAAGLKWNKDSIDDDPRSARPKTTDEQVDAINRMVFEDRYLSILQIAKSIGITFGSFQTVLTEILVMGKLFTRWAQRMLMQEHKLIRFQDYPMNVLRRLTHDETCVSHFEPQSKIENTLVLLTLRSSSRQRLLAR